MYYFLPRASPWPWKKKMVGLGSQYAWAAVDAHQNALDGTKNYKVRLGPIFRSRTSGR
jgi:hypothetical protein